MGERAVRFRHLVSFFFLFDRSALVGRGIHQFASEFLGIAFAGASTRVGDEPSHRERVAPDARDFDWDLQRRTTDAAGFDFEAGARVAERGLENLDRVLFRLVANDIKRVIHQPLRGDLFAAFHNAVDELRDDHAIVFGIGKNGMVLDLSSSWHLHFLRNGHRKRRDLSRFSATSGFRHLGTILAAALAALFDTGRVQGATDDVVAHTRQILDAAAANQYYRVLL